MKKYLIIYNPKAGKVKRHHYLKKLEEAIKKNGDEYRTIKTKEAFDAYDEVKDNIEDFDYVVAAGGDGTINEVLTGLMESSKPDTPLGILPIGSGNDSFKLIEKHIDVDKAIEILVDKNTRKVDIGKRVGGKSYKGEYMLNLSCMGLDSLASKKATNIKKKLGGPIGYFLGLLYALFVFRKLHLEIELDDGKIHSKSALLCFGNGRYYGGGIKIMPWARNDDGYFHILNLVDINNLMLLFLLPTLLLGVHDKVTRYVKIYKSKSIKISGLKDVDFNVDGENYDDLEEIEYECIEGGLNLIS